MDLERGSLGVNSVRRSATAPDIAIVRESVKLRKVSRPLETIAVFLLQSVNFETLLPRLIGRALFNVSLCECVV